MKTMAVDADARLTGLLPGFNFADAYRQNGVADKLSAGAAAAAIFEAPPRWVECLMSARNRIAGVFGLKAGRHGASAAGKPHLGIFPILAERPEEILLGLDDRHLDFRLVVTVQVVDQKSRQVTVTTIVKTHNALGRAYLTAILPFHRLIARCMLDRAAKTWGWS